MKRRDLERHLLEHGCKAIREGANHAIWANPPADLRAALPRHREIPAGTARDLPPARHPAARWPALTRTTSPATGTLNGGPPPAS